MADALVSGGVESIDGGPYRRGGAPIPTSEIDRVLTAQFVVAWAGEGGEEAKMGWWRCDLASEFGGEDLLRRLLPHTWRWAVLQGVREAARRTDAALRRHGDHPDHIQSLFNFGFDVDERVEERLQDLKRSGQEPRQALPGLADGIGRAWNRQRFCDWAEGHGDAKNTVTSVGRHIKGTPPSSLEQRLRHLVANLLPLADRYPLPHYRRAL